MKRLPEDTSSTEMSGQLLSQKDHSDGLFFVRKTSDFRTRKWKCKKVVKFYTEQMRGENICLIF